jgi:hypothetical protein
MTGIPYSRRQRRSTECEIEPIPLAVRTAHEALVVGAVESVRPEPGAPVAAAP